MFIDLGDQVPLSVEIRDQAGALANAGAVACTVTLPDGTTTAVPTANPSTGTYTATYTPTVPGPHGWRMVATGTNASSFVDVFTVIDPATLGVIGLPDLKGHLNIGLDDHDHDDELRATILASSDSISRHLHRPVRRETRSRTWVTTRGTGQVLVLPQPDVAAITSVTADGQTLTAGDYTADLHSGVLYREAGWPPPVTVTWTTRPVDGADVRQAVLEMCRHLWETQRGQIRSNLPLAGDGSPPPGAGYSLPNRVAELLAPARSHT